MITCLLACLLQLSASFPFSVSATVQLRADFYSPDCIRAMYILGSRCLRCTYCPAAGNQIGGETTVRLL